MNRVEERRYRVVVFGWPRCWVNAAVAIILYGALAANVAAEGKYPERPVDVIVTWGQVVELISSRAR